MAGFQSVINAKQAPALEGDFAGANPRHSVLAGEGALIAGPLGVTVGRFARANPATGLVTNADPAAPARLAFVHRSNQRALITAFLGQATTLVMPGTEISLCSSGDFWARFAVAPTMMFKVFASYLDGTCSSGVAGSIPAGASFTGVIAATTGVLTASAVTGPIYVGAPITGTSVPTGTLVTAQLTGVANGAGTYSTNTATAVASTAMTTPSAAETDYHVAVPYAAGELSQITVRG